MSNCAAFIDGALPAEFVSERSEIETELHEILENFFRSKAYAELAGAKILGREVPLLMPWQDQIMEGVIDLIYEKNGLLYLADYKTDRIKRSELRAGAERYRQQAEIYIAGGETKPGPPSGRVQANFSPRWAKRLKSEPSRTQN